MLTGQGIAALPFMRRAREKEAARVKVFHSALFYDLLANA